jgi:hypothetical protein
MIGRKAILFIMLAAASLWAEAQSMEPRFYSNSPVGMNFALAGYGLSTGSVTADPSVELENGDIEIHSFFAAYARSMGLWGRNAKFDIVVPYASLSGSATVQGAYVERSVDGFADPQFRFSYNFLGAPALTLKEFKDYRQEFVMGASLKVIAPFGQYDETKVVNLGANRWAFTPEIGMSRSFGPLLLELAAAATWYTENDDFAGQTRKQDPIYALQGHIVYTLPKGIWLALDATYYGGGRTTVGGVQKSDLQQNTRLGATLALPVSLRNSIKLYASSGVATRTGSDFDTVGAAWQYRWGGGL